MAEAIVVSVTDSRTSADIVSLTEVKNYLRITNDTDDTEIQDMIDNSIDAVERHLEQDIYAKNRQMYLDSVSDDFQLYFAPIDITGTFTVNVDGNDITEYELRGIQDPFVSLNQLPSEKIIVTYTTKGITTLSRVKQGIKARVAWLYLR